MAHELQAVLDFVKKYGDDVFTCFDGTKHKMSEYAAVLQKFVKQEVKDVKVEVAKVVEKTKENVVQLQVDANKVAEEKK